MSEPEQCIICLDPLPHPSSLDADDTGGGGGGGGSSSSPSVSLNGVGDAVPVPATTAPEVNGEDSSDDTSYLNIVAALDGCNHIIHDACIRSWAQKTNTCPICRNPFHSIRVYNGVDGTVISKYEVQDKKQVAEFDVQQWLGENPEEEEEQNNPCPICNSAEREDVLLLCDSCDAAYHTHCVGLEVIPDGDWYCMECSHLFQLTEEPDPVEGDRTPRPQVARRPTPRNVRGYHVRTRARLRRARRQARNAEWQGAWGQFSGRFYEMSELDLDNHDEEDEELEQYRRFQELGRRELERWQQRMEIAQRLGARDAFANNIPPAISERLQPPPPPVEETRDERRAWGALDRVREAEEPAATTTNNTRKRKVRSVTASPREPVQEPERKLKRPRTRRLPTHNGEGSSSMSSPAPAGPSTLRATNGASRSGVQIQSAIDPPLVSSLLKELEPGAMSDDETTITINGWRQPPDASSPAISPAISPFSSPRALSLTPPPLPSVGGRSTSPTLSLSTHIQPRYPPANYSPTRVVHSDHSDSESRPSKPEGRPLELRQPRPRRPHQVPAQKEEDQQPQPHQSPTRWTMTQEEKKNINDIVKCALRPHWRAQRLTTEQYATINRDISRKLYDEVKNASSLNGEARQSWERRASKEVAQAVSELQA